MIECKICQRRQPKSSEQEWTLARRLNKFTALWRVALISLTWIDYVPVTAFAPSALLAEHYASKQFDGHVLSLSEPDNEKLPSQSQKMIFSNFWFIKVREKSDFPDDEAGLIVPTATSTDQSQKPYTIPPLPCVSSLDSEGMLPPTAYMSSSTESKKISRIQLAWDVSDLHHLDAEITPDDVAQMVKTVQNALDHGMTSFQSKGPQDWMERNIYRSLIRETPNTVLDHMHLTIPLYLQDVTTSRTSGSSVSQMSVRSTLLASFSRMNIDWADNVQIRFGDIGNTNSNSDMKLRDLDSYYLDVLDTLQELKRDGLVGSISTAHMTDPFLQKARNAGFGHLLSTNQLDSNLLDPAAGILDQKSLQHPLPTDSSKKNPSTILSSPLAGGWLTDRFLHVQKNQSKRNSIFDSLSLNEETIWQTSVLGAWSIKHGVTSKDAESLLLTYEQKMLLPLRDIARKYGVSMASVVLRWTLQLESVAGTVVSTRLLPDRHYWKSSYRTNRGSRSRSQQLRQVYQFELDYEDMERLSDLSGAMPSGANEVRQDTFGSSEWMEQNSHLIL